MLYYHSVSGSGIDKKESQCKQKLELMKIMICFNRSWMYICPVRWYTVVDEMSVDEVSVDEVS